MIIIVGLGNPGKKFVNTRHNSGFLVLDKLKSQITNHKSQITNKPQLSNFKYQKRLEAEVCKIGEALLAKPQTFMNRSGEAVVKILRYYKIRTYNNLYVVHDDLDIKLGEYKIQFGKGPRQHKGIKSIEQHLKTKDFWRVRVGVENRREPVSALETPHRLIQPRSVLDTSAGKDYVLQKFSKQEKIILDKVINKIVVKLIVV